MSVLSALLARDRVVPPQKIDEAIQRQVINGGDFETNLLEVGAILEDTLAGYCAAVHEGEAIGRDEISQSEPATIALVSRELAEEHRVVPVRVLDGKLIVASIAPLSTEARAAIERLARLPVEERIATPFRVAWALSKFYGTELSSRLQRLAARLDKNPSTQIPRVTMPPSTPPRLSNSPTATQPHLRASVLAALSAALSEDRESMPDGFVPAPRVSLASRAKARANPPPPVETKERARERIGAAKDRDEIVDALLTFVQARVAYVAIFVAHGDVAEGLDARGQGLDADSVRRLAVPLDAPGAFRTVRERGEPVLGPLAHSNTDTVVKADLGRAEVQHVALLPIPIGGRVALILWADNGLETMDLAIVEPISAICAEAARGFERVILERKKRRTVADTASAAAAAIAAAGSITTSVEDIAGQLSAAASLQGSRGRSIVPPLPTTETPTLGMLVSGEAVARDTMPDDVSMPANRDHGEAIPSAHESTESVGRHSMTSARGARVPVSVEVIGGPSGPATAPKRAVSLRAQDPRREPDENAEPVSTGDEASTLVAHIVRGETLSDDSANLLLSAGERGLQAVFRLFPGPSNIDRNNTRSRVPPVGEIGPLLRLVTMFRQAAGPHLVEQLESYDPERRYFATLCLSEIVFPSALDALVPRLFDTDYPTAVIAIEALRAYRRVPEFEGVAQLLRSTVSDANQGSDRRRIAANVLGEIRDAESVPALLLALGDRDGALAGIARRALVVLCRQDFGQDTEQWQKWWDSASHQNRVEWLIAGLLHADSTIRHESSEELKKLTGQFFGYYFNLPRRERERAHQRYTEWWQRDGRAKFSST